MTRRDFLVPVIAAIVVTGFNAFKPAVVDDAAYLRMAEQVAHHPSDPYGFEQFWYAKPQPAMQVLAPPVVPYLLAIGMAVSDDLRVVKLALFPAVWILMIAAFDLFRRFSPGREQLGILVLASSPAVLPMVNAMLDIPAAGLGLASIALFARGCDAGRHRKFAYALGAGLLAGLAFQAKYSALGVPVVLIWYALLRCRMTLAILAVMLTIVVAASWEFWLSQKYGQSHFLYHIADQSSDGSFEDQLDLKWSFARPLLNYLGLLGCGWALIAGRAMGMPRWLIRLAMIAFGVGLFVVVLGPLDWLRPARELTGYPRLGFTLNLFGLSGLLTLLTIVAGLVLKLGRSRKSWFLAGWLAIEIVACLALTPFPAGRRVIMVSVVLGFIAMRLARLTAPSRDVIGYCIGLGVLLAALDHWDARPEMVLAEQAAITTRPGGTVWTQGAWGWQYYTHQQGFRAAVAGNSRLQPGDWLVLTTVPPVQGFFRPGDPNAKFDLDSLELVETLVADDAFPYTTLPPLYGGPSPILGRDFPRLTVKIYRVVRATTALPVTD